MDIKIRKNREGKLEYSAMNATDDMTSNMLKDFASLVRSNTPLIEKPKISIFSIIKVFLIILAVFIGVAFLLKGIDFLAELLKV